MDISSLGSMYLDNVRLSANSTVHSPENFQDILERTLAKQTTVSENEITRSGISDNIVSGNNGARSAQTPIDKNDKLYQLCLELETFLVKNILTGMRNTVQKSGLIDDSFAGKMYEDMLWDEYAKDYTRNANFGLAEQAYRQLSRYS